MVTIDKIFHAQTVLKGIIRPTPLAKAYGIAPECNLYFKPENLQNTGSFKLRGSGYKIAQLSDEEKAKGVIACSAGNHAQGVAQGGSPQAQTAQARGAGTTKRNAPCREDQEQRKNHE